MTKSTWKNCYNIIFLLLIIVHLIPIWIFKYFPSQDGPAHIENATIIREYNQPERSVFRKYYTFNKNFTPTWIGHLILAGLMYIVPLLVAEKIFISGYVVLLPLSVRYALKAIRQDTDFLAYLSFPFIYNYFFHLGFYEFSYSLALFFFVMGFWLKYREEFTPKKVLILTFLSLLLFFFHVVSFVMAYVAIIILTIWFILIENFQKGNSKKLSISEILKVFQKKGLPVFFAFLPSFMLFLLFLNPIGLKVDWSKLLIENASKNLFKFNDLLQIEPLVSYQRVEFYLSLALGIFLWVLFLYIFAAKKVHRNSLLDYQLQLDIWDGILFVIFGYVLMFWITPDEISGFGLIHIRLNIYPFFMLIIWFRAQSYSTLVKRIIVFVITAIALATLSFHTIKYAELNDYMEEYLSGIQLIEPNTTILPLSFFITQNTESGLDPYSKVNPFLHASGYIGAIRGVVDFSNFEAHLSWFPLRFRQDLDPYVHIGIDKCLECVPPKVDFLTYPKRTGGQVDYVLVWDQKKHQRNDEYTRSIFKQLKEGYQLIYTSPKRGLMKLYRRKELGEVAILNK